MWLNDSYDAIHQRAASLVQQGKLEEAVAEYRRIVDRLTRLSPGTLHARPDMAELLEHAATDMVYLLQRLQSYDEAIEVIGRIATIFPERRLIWQREIAVLKSVKGDREAALTEMQAVVLAAPTDPSMRWALAQIYSSRKEFDTARQQLIQAIDLSPDNETKAIGYRYLGDLFARLNDVDQMAKAWDMVLALDPKKIDNVQFVYRQLLHAGKPLKARAYIDRDRDANRRALYSGIASMLEGDERSARAQWRRAFRKRPQSGEDATDAWAEAGLRLGETQQVLDTLMPMLSGTVSLRTLILLGIAWAKNGNEAQAELFFSHIRRDLMPIRDMTLPRNEWELLQTLGVDEAIAAKVKHHFDTGEEALEQTVTESPLSRDG